MYDKECKMSCRQRRIPVSPKYFMNNSEALENNDFNCTTSRTRKEEEEKKVYSNSYDELLMTELIDDDDETQEYLQARRVLEDFHRIQSLPCIPEESFQEESEEEEERPFAGMRPKSSLVSQGNMKKTSLSKNSQSFCCLSDLIQQQEDCGQHLEQRQPPQSSMANDDDDSEWGYYPSSDNIHSKTHRVHKYEAIFLTQGWNKNYKRKVQVHFTKPRGEDFPSPPTSTRRSASYYNNLMSASFKRRTRQPQFLQQEASSTSPPSVCDVDLLHSSI